MPQLEQISTWPSQIFWLIVTFSVMYWLMVRFIIPRLALILELRAGKISSNLKNAEEDRQKADEMSAGYEYSVAIARFQADNIIREAREDQARLAEDSLKKLEEEFVQRLAETEERINQTRNEAVGELNKMAESLVADITRSITGKALPPKNIALCVNKVAKEYEAHG